MDWWINGLMGKDSGINPIIHLSTNPFRRWSARQDLHLRSLGPRPSMLLLHYALLSPACSLRRSRRTQDTNPGNGPAVSSLKMADPNPDSELGLNPPVDNPDAVGTD